jgi:hypothetical protein
MLVRIRSSIEYSLERLAIEKDSEIIFNGLDFILDNASVWSRTSKLELTPSTASLCEVWHTRPGGLFSTITPRSTYRATFDRAARDISWADGIRSQEGTRSEGKKVKEPNT